MKQFAVFDIDGTLIRWQLYHAVVNRLAKDGLLGAGSYKKLHEARMVWKRRESQDAFHQYEKIVIRIFNVALPLLDTVEFDKTVDRVIKDYKDQTYTYTSSQVESLKSKGYVLLAISGSGEELVSRVAKHFGFDDWVGSTYARRNKKFTGKLKSVAHDKKAELEKLVKKHSLTYESSWGFGDSESDAAILDMVENPVAFNPDRRLLYIAKSKGWDIVVERKNVVYKLKDKNGSYVLA